MSDDDLLTSLVSGAPQSDEQVKAIVNQLRGKTQLGQLAMLSGDPTLAPFGQHLLQQNQQNEVELGRNAMANRRDEISQGQLNRQLTQGDATLAETIRYHNMEDQERKDKLAQQKALQQDLADSQATIDKIGQYQMAPPTLSRSPKNLAILEEVAKQYPNYDATKWTEKSKAQVDFGSGPSSNLVKSADVAIQHLDTADELASGLHNTNNHFANQAVNWWKTNITGDPAMVKFNAAKSVISGEIDKFIIGGGTGAGALEDRKMLQGQLDAANSPEQLKEVSNTLRTLMGGQLKGLQSKFVNAGLGSPEDFLKRLDPRTVGALGFGQAQPPPQNALPGATAAAQGGPPPGSGPLQGPAPSGPGPLPAAAASGAPGARPGSISPLEATLQSQTGFQGNGQPAPKSSIVDQNGIVRTGRKRVNGKMIRVGQLADGTVVPLE